MAADFSHDDLMFATRLARMGGGRDRRGLDLLAAMSGGGGGNRGEQTDALVGALVQSALAERQAKVEAGLRRAAADSDWEKRRAAAVEDRDAGSARFFAELGARKNSEERARAGAVEDRDFGAKDRGAARKAEFEQRTRELERADRQARNRAIYEQTGEWPADDASPTTQPGVGGVGFGKQQRDALTNEAIATLVAKVKSGEISPEQMQNQLAGLRDPKNAMAVAAPPPRRSAEEQVGDLVRATATSKRGTDWDVSAGKLYGMLDADQSLREARDQSIVRLLKAGKKPAEIGYMAKAALLGQSDLPIGSSSTAGKIAGETLASVATVPMKLLGIGPGGTLESDSVFSGDRFAPHEYGEHWRQRAEELLASLR